MAATARRISLTFDNGPSAPVTGEVLDILAERGIRATFFPVGAQLETPGATALLDRIAAAGHAIGNHTYSHPRPFGALSAEAAIAEIERTDVLLAGRQSPEKFFRPSAGGGALRPGVLNRGVADFLLEQGYTLVLWNLIVEDWKRADGSWVDLALEGARAQPWTNLVLHDIRDGGMAHLARFLDAAAAEGMTFTDEIPPETVPVYRGALRQPIDGLI